MGFTAAEKSRDDVRAADGCCRGLCVCVFSIRIAAHLDDLSGPEFVGHRGVHLTTVAVAACAAREGVHADCGGANRGGYHRCTSNPSLEWLTP